MKKFLLLTFCFALICACGKKQDLSEELLGQKEEAQIIAAMEFLTQETQVPQEIKTEEETIKPAPKAEQKPAVKTTRQTVKTEQKQEPAATGQEKQDVQIPQLKEGENTVEIFLDPNYPIVEEVPHIPQRNFKNQRRPFNTPLVFYASFHNFTRRCKTRMVWGRINF